MNMSDLFQVFKLPLPKLGLHLLIYTSDIRHPSYFSWTFSSLFSSALHFVLPKNPRWIKLNRVHEMWGWEREKWGRYLCATTLSIHFEWVHTMTLNETLSKFWLITAWNKCGTKELCSTLYMLEEWTCCCLISSLSFTSTWAPPFAERACNVAVQGCVIFPDLWHFFFGRDLKELIGEAVFVSLWLLNSRVYLFLIQLTSIICL